MVCIAFRERGHEAYSCDILPCSGGHQEWHIQGDAIKEAYSGKYDIMIAHPPCTYLTVTGNGWLKEQPRRKSGALVGMERRKAMCDAVGFFMELINAPINKIAVENPIGVMSTKYRKPDQIIHPYYFGDPVSKATCLWLKNLPMLRHYEMDNIFHPKTHVNPQWYTAKSGRRYPKWSLIDACKYPAGEERSKFRSKTFPGIAMAMADQWGK